MSSAPKNAGREHADDRTPADEPTPVEPVDDPETGEELGEVSGGGDITDLGGDAPSS